MKTNTYKLDELQWVYEELIRVEKHWTEQVQNEQSRIATLLTVSGILLGFLTGAGFLTNLLEVRDRPWPVYVYILSLVSLCFALFMGIRALRPAIGIAGGSESPPDWLNQDQILKYASSMPLDDLLRKLCDSAATNQRDARHPERLRERRTLMLRQVTFLMLSLGLLIAAVAGVLVANPEAVRGPTPSSAPTAGWPPG